MGTHEWNFEQELRRLAPSGLDSVLPIFSARAPRQYKLSSTDIQEHHVDECRLIVAAVIDLFGERYLPLFERLDEERHLYRSKKSLIKRAKELASRNTEF